LVNIRFGFYYGVSQSFQIFKYTAGAWDSVVWNDYSTINVNDTKIFVDLTWSFVAGDKIAFVNINQGAAWMGFGQTATV